MKQWMICGILGLGLVFCAMQAISCGSKEESEQEQEKTITLWCAQYVPGNRLVQLADEFVKETGIDVEIRRIPWDSFQKEVLQDFSNKQTAFDLLIGDSQWINYCVRKEHYLELTDWIGDAVDLDALKPLGAKYLCELPAGSGKYYAVPFRVDDIAFVYRKDWFDDSKYKMEFLNLYNRDLIVPKTWKQLSQVAKFFTRKSKNQYGCALLTGRGYDSLAVGSSRGMWTYGESWENDKTSRGHGPGVATVEDFTHALLMQPIARDLLKFSPPDKADFGSSKSLTAFKSGSTAIAMDYASLCNKTAIEMGKKTGIFTLTSPAGQATICLGGQAMSISAKTSERRQKLAKKFIAWLAKKN